MRCNGFGINDDFPGRMIKEKNGYKCEREAAAMQTAAVNKEERRPRGPAVRGAGETGLKLAGVRAADAGRTGAHLRLSVGREIVELPCGEITAVASDANYCRIAAAGRELRVRATFSEVKKQLLCDGRFLEINRGVLVNMDRVLSMENTDCRMCGGLVYPVNFRRRAELRRRLTAYQLRRKI
jgi:DNA-binding LytR/AlgR family response regulator